MLVAKVYGDSDKGLVRTNNEDAFIAQKVWDDSHWLLVVVDGLGGYEGGEVAATIAQETILQTVKEMKGEDCLDAIIQSVTDANNAIFNQRSSEEGLSDMGCVVTAAILDLEKKQLNVAHVGDTRLYQLDGNGLIKLTHDHSFVGALEDEGSISEEDAMNHPRRNLIDRIVGDDLKETESPKFIEGAVFPVAKGNQYLLCSDGLSDMLSSVEINSVLQKGVNVKKKVNQLIEAANKNGGKDNVTVIVASIDSEQIKRNIKGNNLPVQVGKKKNKQNKQKKHNYKQSIDLNNESTDSIFKIGFITMIILLVVLVVVLLIQTKL